MPGIRKIFTHAEFLPKSPRALKTEFLVRCVNFGYVLMSATRFILEFATLSRVIEMSKRLRSKEFLALADLLWQGDAKVLYQNPDNWIIM
jgi:hypothetical protein